MNSKFFAWNGFDVLKAAIVSAGTAGLTALSQQLDIGHIPSKKEVIVIGIAAASAFISYMLKNLFQNSNGKIAATEPEIKRS
jgi:hypothetical protein